LLLSFEITQYYTMIYETFLTDFQAIIETYKKG